MSAVRTRKSRLRKAGRQGGEARKETEAGPAGMGSEEIPEEETEQKTQGKSLHKHSGNTNNETN